MKWKTVMHFRIVLAISIAYCKHDCNCCVEGFRGGHLKKEDLVIPDTNSGFIFQLSWNITSCQWFCITTYLKILKSELGLLLSLKNVHCGSVTVSFTAASYIHTCSYKSITWWYLDNTHCRNVEKSLMPQKIIVMTQTEFLSWGTLM